MTWMLAWREAIENESDRRDDSLQLFEDRHQSCSNESTWLKVVDCSWCCYCFWLPRQKKLVKWKEKFALGGVRLSGVLAEKEMTGLRHSRYLFSLHY